MALKDWKKLSVSSSRYSRHYNSKINKDLEVKKLPANHNCYPTRKYIVTSENKYLGTFNKKSAALKYAKSYMEKH